MKIWFVTPRAELRPYIESFWVLESPTGLPASASSIAAPNGCAKLIFPYDNSIVSEADGRIQLTRAQHMNFVGNRDSATLIRTTAQPTGFIAIEFRPSGAFPIFGVPMSETANRLWETDDVFGRWSLGVQETVNNLERVNRKVAYIQRQLMMLLKKHRCEPGLVDYCVGALRYPSTDGYRSASWSGRPAIPGAISIGSSSSTSACLRRCWPKFSGSSAFIGSGLPARRSIW